MRIAVFTAFVLALACSGAAWAASPAPAPTSAPGKGAPAPKPATPHLKAKPTTAELAARGDAEALYLMGKAALESGKGSKAGQTNALAWFTLAGGYGHAEAALGAARILEQRGNFALAAHWWLRAGELGDHGARDHLLDLYLDGRIAGIGDSTAAGWLASRADGGDSRAQMALGELYERGRGIPVDFDQAQRWYQTAALGGDYRAMVRLGRLQMALPATWRAPSRETDKDGKWQGPATQPLRPGARDRDKRLDLGQQAVAEGWDIDPAKLHLFRPGMVSGEHWLRFAARRGERQAQLALGRALTEGIDLPLDMAKGIRWLEAAAWQRDPEALMLLADLAANGRGFPAKDPVRAWAEDDLAAALGAKGAEEARDRIGKTLNPRQMARARQFGQDMREGL